MRNIFKYVLGGLLLGSVAFAAANRVWESQEWLSGQITTPSNPSAGKFKFYFKSDGDMYKLNSSGVEEQVGGGGSAAEVTFASGGTIVASNVQDALAELDSDIVAHLGDTADAHDASAISNVASGNISATDVQAAIEELDTEKATTASVSAKQDSDADLTAISALSSTGILSRTGAGTYSERTITGTADQITVTNGSGAAGNPTLSIPSDPVLPGTKLTIGTSSGVTYLTGSADPTVTATSANIGSVYTNTTTGDIYRKTDSGSSTNWSLIGTSAAVTAPVAYTPTIVGCGTVSSVNFYYRQIGDYLHIEGSFISGTPAATPTTFTLPNSGTIGTINSNTLVGSGTRNNAAGGVYSVIATASGASTLGIGNKSGANGLAVVNCNSIIASGDVVAVNAVVRVAGLSSVVNTATTPVITAFTAYTPTFTGFGTASAVSFRYRQIGSGVEVEGVFTSGTSTATEARISLPTVCASAASDYSTLEVAGSGAQTTAGRNMSALIEPSATYFTIGEISGAAGLTKKNGNAIISSGEKMSFRAFVRCTGMPGVIPAPNLVGFMTTNASTAQRTEYGRFAGATYGVECSVDPCLTYSLSTTGWISDVDETGTGDYTVTLASGIFSSAPVCVGSTSCAVASNCPRMVQIDAVSATSLRVRSYNIAGALDNAAVNLQCIGPR